MKPYGKAGDNAVEEDNFKSHRVPPTWKGRELSHMDCHFVPADTTIAGLERKAKGSEGRGASGGRIVAGGKALSGVGCGAALRALDIVTGTQKAAWRA